MAPAIAVGSWVRADPRGVDGVGECVALADPGRSKGVGAAGGSRPPPSPAAPDAVWRAVEFDEDLLVIAAPGIEDDGHRYECTRVDRKGARRYRRCAPVLGRVVGGAGAAGRSRVTLNRYKLLDWNVAAQPEAAPVC